MARPDSPFSVLLSAVVCSARESVSEGAAKVATDSVSSAEDGVPSLTSLMASLVTLIRDLLDTGGISGCSASSPPPAPWCASSVCESDAGPSASKSWNKRFSIEYSSHSNKRQGAKRAFISPKNHLQSASLLLIKNRNYNEMLVSEYQDLISSLLVTIRP